MHIAAITGSTRPNRRSRKVADWVLAEATSRQGATFDLVDLADLGLPMYEEPEPAAVGSVSGEEARRWGDLVDTFDAFIFVVPEYNHSFPAVIKNAIDLVYRQWNDKSVGFVTYGLQGGVRAAEQLRCVVSEVKLASVRSHVALSLFTDFTLEDMLAPGEVTPGAHQAELLQRLFDELIAWGGALKFLREANARSLEEKPV